MNKVYIYGKHAVLDAVTLAPHVVDKVFVEPDQHEEIDRLAKKRGIFRSPFNERVLEKKLGEHAVHQGVAAIIDTEKLVQDFSALEALLDPEKQHALVLLGEVQDPQNVGSIIRSAAAFGVSAVLIPKDRQAQITGSVIKASVGTAFRVPIIGIGNVNQSVRALKERHFWIYGLSGDTEETRSKNIRDEDFSENTVFIVGNESTGIREKTSEYCDQILTIPISEQVDSLNAGTSAAIAFYEWSSKQK